MKKIGVIGHTGFIGSQLIKQPNFVPITCTVREAESVKAEIRNSNVDMIVNLAAISDVDYCEDPKHKEEVLSVNVRGAYNVCDEAELMEIPVILLSTDHVFKGNWGPSRSGPYGEKSKPDPINFYGLSKFGAEQMALTFDNAKIVRTSRLFNEKMLDFTEKSYPTFLRRTFMYLPHFIESFVQYVENFDAMPKLLHISGSECVSWFTFMSVLFKEFGQDVHKVLHRTGEMPDKYAPRPHYAGLKTDKARKLGLPQYTFAQGISAMRQEHLVRQLYG